MIAISQAFPDAIGQNYEHLISLMNNDQKAPILAAAVKTEAEIIVTSNLTDFPDYMMC